MDATTALLDVHRRSVQVYMRLQQLTLQGQQVQAAITDCQRELLMLDGEERAIVALTAKERTDGQ